MIKFEIFGFSLSIVFILFKCVMIYFVFAVERHMNRVHVKWKKKIYRERLQSAHFFQWNLYTVDVYLCIIFPILSSQFLLLHRKLRCLFSTLTDIHLFERWALSIKLFRYDITIRQASITSMHVYVCVSMCLCWS